MRKARCTECKQVFYSTDGQTICQDCSGTAPDKVEQTKVEAEARKVANAHPETTQPQTLDVKSLTDSKPRRNRKKAAPKATGGKTDAPAS